MKEVEPNPNTYRRQFLLTSESISGFSTWKKAKVGGSCNLLVQPDLGFTQIKRHENELTLLGYIIDPSHPERDNKEILSDLLQKDIGGMRIFEQTERFSGRFILIFSNHFKSFLFCDPGGLRSVYYTAPELPVFYCASQPRLINNVRGQNPEKENAFFDSKYFKKEKEYWWPGGTSLCKGIKHLLPNHYLNLKSMETKRFWPTEKIRPVEKEESVVKSSEILKNIMMGGATRFKLAIPITAGLDSRVLLAASKNIRDINYYTLMLPGMNRSSPDIRIPKKLLPFLGLAHEVVDCREQMDAGFKELYENNVDSAHPYWGDIAFGINKHYPEDRVCVKGNCAEIARCFYYKYVYPKNITGVELARLNGMGRNQFCIAGFDDWLKKTRDVARANNLDILDLFYWEHRVGSWQAMSQLEWDLIMETYTPFNCRELICSLLSVNQRYRKHPKYELFVEIIQNLWKDVLKEPINPQLFKYTLRPFIKKSVLLPKQLMNAIN